MSDRIEEYKDKMIEVKGNERREFDILMEVLGEVCNEEQIERFVGEEKIDDMNRREIREKIEKIKHM